MVNLQTLKETIPPTGDIRALLSATVRDRRFLLELLRLAERRTRPSPGIRKPLERMGGIRK